MIDYKDEQDYGYGMDDSKAGTGYPGIHIFSPILKYTKSVLETSKY